MKKIIPLNVWLLRVPWFPKIFQMHLQMKVYILQYVVDYICLNFL